MTDDYDLALLTAFWAWVCDRIDKQPIGAKEFHLYVDDFLTDMRSRSPAFVAAHDSRSVAGHTGGKVR